MSKDYHEVSILLIEDDDIDAKSVERSFRKLKLLNPIRRAKNGIEALSILRGKDGEEAIERPYIILLDLNMPIMGGHEFLRALRDDKSLSDSVVFVLTTSEADKDIASAYDSNIAGYIVKSDVQDGFAKLIDMLDHYWRIVLLPK